MRKLSITLALLLCISLMAGCGGGSIETPKPSAEAPEPSAQETPAITSESPAAPEATPDSVVETGIEPGMRAPDFQLELRGGGEVTLEELKGKPVFINLFATWCGPCVREMPDIQSVYELYGDKVHFLAIDLGEEKSEVDKFLDDYGFTFPVAYDFDGAVGDAYGAMYIPLTYMLDSQGIIVAAVNQSTDAKTMTSLIEEALAR